MREIKIAKKKSKKMNSFLWGLIPGLIVPMITISIFYTFKFNSYTIGEFIDLMKYNGVFTKVISLCVIPNLLLFFVCIWTDRYTPGKGVILATFVYTILVLILKY